MPQNSHDSNDDVRNTPGPDDETVLERVQELTWALLDQYATDDDLKLLDALLLSDDRARQTYLRCVQLHTDLYSHFAGSGGATATQSPLLALLGGANPLDPQSSTVID